MLVSFVKTERQTAATHKIDEKQQTKQISQNKINQFVSVRKNQIETRPVSIVDFAIYFVTHRLPCRVLVNDIVAATLQHTKY